MIEIKNLSKSFDRVQALSNINMAISEGSVYGILGPNGAGKTTLLRHLTGVYSPDEGTVTICQKDIQNNMKVKEKIAYIPDEIYHFFSSTTNDLMKYYRGAYPDFDTNRFNELAETFSSINPKTPLRKLSKGMKRQAFFWVILCCKAEILILDEPVDGLDPVMRKNIWSMLMTDVAENHTTILISSHNLRELENLCDHIAIFDKGKLILDRSMSELQENVTKLQISFEDEGEKLPNEIHVISSSVSGRLHTYIIDEKPDTVTKLLSDFSPSQYEIIPLTLEEIFINEIGGINHEQSKNLL